jgi:hypothetical protein
MDSLKYENFIRTAFGYVLNSDRKMIEKSEDPAELAYAGYFTIGNINKVKAATAYAMSVYRAVIVDSHNCSEDDYDIIENLIGIVINAESLSAISEAIDQFKSQIVRKYLN